MDAREQRSEGVRQPPAAASPTLRFGSFELDTEAEQLTKDGRIVRLQPQPFKLLWLLCSQPGRLLTREEIRSALWTGDTFVDFEQGVNFAIKQVREALNDDAERPVFVQTVPRRGYRFIAPVQLVTPRGAHGSLGAGGPLRAIDTAPVDSAGRVSSANASLQVAAAVGCTRTR